mgnify:CR=1 FL=1
MNGDSIRFLISGTDPFIIEQINFHTKAFTFLLLLGLASLASAHGSLPSATPTTKTLPSHSPLGQATPFHFKPLRPLSE